MRRLILLSTLLAMGGGMLSCGPSTTLKNSWRDPSVTGPMQFGKVLALMVDKDGATRRSVEDQMVQRITARGRTQAVAAYTILSEADLQDKEHARQVVEQAGVDGAVVLRVAAVDKQTTYVPGTYPQPYYNFYGYNSYAWPMAYDPGYIQTDTIVDIETLIYSVKDAKLIWSGTTETFNPSSTSEILEGVAAAVSAELLKQGLIK